MADKANDKTTISLNPDTRARVERLAAEKQVTVSEIFRRSLVLFDFVSTQTEQGAQLVLRYPNGELEGIHLLFA